MTTQHPSICQVYLANRSDIDTASAIRHQLDRDAIAFVSMGARTAKKITHHGKCSITLHPAAKIPDSAVFELRRIAKQTGCRFVSRPETILRLARTWNSEGAI